MRKAHKLEPTSGENRPTHMIFFDTETIPTEALKKGFVHRLKLGVAHHYIRQQDGKFRFLSECIFTSGEEFAAYISTHVYDKILLYVVAHNVKFDILVSDVLTELPNKGFHITGFYIKATTSIFRFRNGAKKVTFIDNGNFFVDTLERIGAMLNYPKMQIDFTSTTDEQLLEYCRNDVTIVAKAWEYWCQFLDDHDLGNFKLTLASTAFSSWRYRFMSHKVWIHTNSELSAKERDAYHGGRVEIYRVGQIRDEITYRLDVNSMYPYVCHKYEFPCSEHPMVENPNKSMLQKKLEKYACIATVELETDEPAYPLVYNGMLPSRRFDTNTEQYYTEIKRRDKLLYPIGDFVTTLTTPELKYALLHNHIRSVLWLVSYQQKPLFRDYIDYFYNLRLKYRSEGNKVYDRICKNFGNSLYGKWGQLDINTNRIGDNTDGKTDIIHAVDGKTGRSVTIYKFLDGVFEQRSGDLAYHSYPAIAAHVTAYARMYLYQLSLIAGRPNVYYSDTDSLTVNLNGYQNLQPYINPDTLGALKVEETMEWLNLFAPKHYETPLTYKHKGISPKAVEVSKNTYRQPQFNGLNSMIDLGITDGVLIEEVEKHLSLEISGGVLSPSGRVSPFVFPLNPQAVYPL